VNVYSRREDDGASYVMALPRPGRMQPELDERGLPKPPDRRLLCFCPPGAAEPCGPLCPANGRGGV
jgi:hypothetical protein